MAERRVVPVADEVWIATALLHREHPERDDFEKREILERAAQEGLVKPQRPGVSVHVSSHAVAGKRPQPNDYRMLIETGRGRRRLYRPGDTCHPERSGKHVPDSSELPPRYLELLSWYEGWKEKAGKKAISDDPLLMLRGSGRQLWADEHADEYVANLRKGWM